jgi:hypothetical protein
MRNGSRSYFLAAVIVTLGSARLARADCAAPGAQQIVVYTGQNFTGTCVTIPLGNWPAWDLLDAGVPNDQIQSMRVGIGARASIYDNPDLTGREADYEGGMDYATLIPESGQFSINVQPNGGFIPATTHISDYPSDRDYFWGDSGGAQGITHDSSNWFLTSTTAIHRIPFSTDLATDVGCQSTMCSGIPSELSNLGYDHMGDPDAFGLFVFVPLESQSSPSNTPIVAAFLASDLSFRGWNYLNGASPDSSGNGHAGWVSIHPTGGSTGTLYTSSANGGVLQEYWFDLRGLGGGPQFLFTGYQNDQQLVDRDGIPIDIQAAQGGDVSDDGHFIYLSNGCCTTNPGETWGVRVFNLATGVLQAKSANGWGIFDYKFDPSFLGFDNQEAEGLDYFDLRGYGIPNMPDSQVHVGLYSNASGSIWLKHYSFPASAL